mmetsp:Transcript_47733/g.108602  ORF Transcript_47733/g.108602 Transcript_47733/m.108602 type:complete len:351 (+) Transcript_47733:103-1155(+)
MLACWRRLNRRHPPRHHGSSLKLLHSRPHGRQRRRRRPPLLRRLRQRPRDTSGARGAVCGRQAAPMQRACGLWPLVWRAFPCRTCSKSELLPDRTQSCARSLRRPSCCLVTVTPHGLQRGAISSGRRPSWRSCMPSTPRVVSLGCSTRSCLAAWPLGGASPNKRTRRHVAPLVVVWRSGASPWGSSWPSVTATPRLQVVAVAPIAAPSGALAARPRPLLRARTRRSRHWEVAAVAGQVLDEAPSAVALLRPHPLRARAAIQHRGHPHHPRGPRPLRQRWLRLLLLCRRWETSRSHLTSMPCPLQSCDVCGTSPSGGPASARSPSTGRLISPRSSVCSRSCLPSCAWSPGR